MYYNLFSQTYWWIFRVFLNFLFRFKQKCDENVCTSVWTFVWLFSWDTFLRWICWIDGHAHSRLFIRISNILLYIYWHYILILGSVNFFHLCQSSCGHKDIFWSIFMRKQFLKSQLFPCKKIFFLRKIFKDFFSLS